MCDAKTGVADDSPAVLAEVEKQNVKRNSIVRKSGFSTDDNRYSFDINPDGTGKDFLVGFCERPVRFSV